ncbi:hypothetical protein [Nocardia sp. XZ_19_231]|uniref:hypothetical protein n=1 Tax=Nocardia sp. XZ_19_231 TaxID=2769252 RepID=UPI00188F448B|nr:hypothetical protein [Nocardia sp. XZ_19_231]
MNQQHPGDSPWKVTNSAPGRYRFTNNTGKEAERVFFQQPRIVGVQLKTNGSTTNSVEGRFQHGDSFEVHMTRLPDARGRARVEIEWFARIGGGNWAKGTWDYFLPD